MSLDERQPRAAGSPACRPAPGELLPSRRQALAALRGALATADGPVLLCGEPGSGKSWLARALADSLPESEWLTIEIAPSTDPRDLQLRLNQALGLEFSSRDTTAFDRRALADNLADLHADGRRVYLVVEELQNARDDVLEELRMLASRLGSPDGFTGLVLLGQTSFLRRLRSRGAAAFASRLSGLVHLAPLGVAETSEWLLTLDPGRDWPAAVVEELHRAGGGNPRRMRTLAAMIGRELQAAPPPSPPRSAPKSSGKTTWRRDPAPSAPPKPAAPEPDDSLWSVLPPSRPPIVETEGMIEVGWSNDPAPVVDDDELAPQPDTPATDSEPASPDPDAPAMALDHVEPTAPPEPRKIEPVSRVVDDPYTAIQAWGEWQANRALSASETDEPRPAADSARRTARSGPQVWLEGEQTFAPYSQLFTRVRPTRDRDG